MKHLTCPYCGEQFDVCHDDGAGYTEDDLHQQDCPACDKTVGFYTYISFSYEARKVDCLNGAPHDMRRTSTYPPEFARMQCKACGHEERKPSHDLTSQG